MNLHYFIQQNLIWVTGLLFYDFYLYRFNNYQLSRIYLLHILLIGIFIPLIDFNFSFENVQYYTIQLGSTPIEYNSLQNQESSNINIWTWIQIVYWLGVIMSIILLLSRFLQLYNLIRSSTKERITNQTHIYNKKIQAPFSFFHFIFLPEALCDNTESKKIILSHETAHQSKFHSLDVLILEFSKIFFWYNPLIYLLKKKIQLVHEFEADQATTDQIEKEKYIDSLLHFNSSNRYSSIVHPFSSQIKKRIIMIQQTYSRLTLGQALLSSLVVFIIIMSIHQCSPSLTAIDKPKHFLSIDTMEIFNPSTYKSEIKIVQSEYDYYTDIPNLPYLSLCSSSSLKERNRCTQSTIINNIKNDPTVIAEFQKINQNINSEIIFLVFDEGQLDRPANFNSGNENFDIAVRNSVYFQQYKFEPGKVNGAPVIVQLKIPFTWKK